MKRISLLIGCLVIFAFHAQAAKITAVKGAPEVLKAQTSEWKAAGKDTALGNDDKIRCDNGSRVEVLLDNGHRIKVWPRSEVALNIIDRAETKIGLIMGRIRSAVKKLKKGQKFEIKTPVAVCSVRGTDFSVELGDDNKMRVEVYEGQVAAREESTGAEVMVNRGEYTAIEANKAPQEPKQMPEGGDETSAGAPEAAAADAAKEESRREVFQEISREEVLARAAEEIKLAEYQNGKAVIDATGNRVRLEEYIVRPQANSFKYVVLNTRPDRFDFGKMVFTFNDKLPEDLTIATKNMFYYEGATKPSLWLTDVVSVMSNTIDQVNEEASAGDMFPDNVFDPRSYSHNFGSYKFYVNNDLWWQYDDNNANGAIESGELTYHNITTGVSGTKLTTMNSDFLYDGGAGKYYFLDSAGRKVYFNELTQPSGDEAMNFYQRSNFSGDQWIAANDYVINDEGKIITLSDLHGLDSAKLEQKAYESNFERVYTASVFNGRKIDLVFSAKLLIDAGILNLPHPKNVD